MAVASGGAEEAAGLRRRKAKRRSFAGLPAGLAGHAPLLPLHMPAHMHPCPDTSGGRCRRTWHHSLLPAFSLLRPGFVPHFLSQGSAQVLGLPARGWRIPRATTALLRAAAHVRHARLYPGDLRLRVLLRVLAEGVILGSPGTCPLDSDGGPKGGRKRLRRRHLHCPSPALTLHTPSFHASTTTILACLHFL